MELCLTGLTLEEEIASTLGGDSYNNNQQQEEQFDIILQSRHRDFKSHINMSDKQQHHQLKPKSTTAIKKKIRRPPSSIQVQLSNKLNDHVDPLDLSFSSSTEDYYHTMNSPGGDNNKRSRSWSPNSSFKDDDDRIREEEWSKLLEKTPPLNRPLGDGEPYISGGSGGIEINPQGVIDIVASNIDNPFPAPPIVKSSASSSPNSKSNKPQPKSILRRRLSSKQQQLTSQDHQKRQQIEMQSILSTLEELQHNFVTNDNSTDANSISNNTHKTTDTPPGVKEYTTISYPNGNLFSGTVSSSSNDKSSSDPTEAELIYGRMTCALEMEVYEGPFKNGKRHGEGAVCTKLDGGAKFLGRYVI